MTPALQQVARDFLVESCRAKYSYGFSWLGRKTIQYPQDLMAFQEIIVSTRPGVIVELGVAHGGTTLFLASVTNTLGLMSPADIPMASQTLILGVEKHFLPETEDIFKSSRLGTSIHVIEGSSVSVSTVQAVWDIAAPSGKRRGVLVILDSDHEASHVLAELRAYADLCRPGDYMVVCDTIVDEVPDGSFPWNPVRRGVGPGQAVKEFLAENFDFEADRSIDERLLISANPGGYLRRKSP